MSDAPAAPRKGRCHACIACCRGCSAAIARSVLLTQAAVGLSIVLTFSMAIFSLVEIGGYTTQINAWRILQSGLTCVVGIWAAYAVGRASAGVGASQLWLTGVCHVLSGLIFFIVMCYDANTVYTNVSVSGQHKSAAPAISPNRLWYPGLLLFFRRGVNLVATLRSRATRPLGPLWHCSTLSLS